MTSRLRRRIVIGVGALFLGVVLPTLGLCAWITWIGASDDKHRADCIIVPGSRVHSSRKLGVTLTARTDHAIDLFREGWCKHIIFTGGKGESGPIESECARDYAIAHGVPADAIYIETVSHTTEANFHAAAAIMQQHHWNRCLVCTDPFHSGRCLRLARDEGLEAWGSPAFQSPTWHRPGMFCYYTLRECAAWVKYVMRQSGFMA